MVNEKAEGAIASYSGPLLGARQGWRTCPGEAGLPSRQIPVYTVREV